MSGEVTSLYNSAAHQAKYDAALAEARSKISLTLGLVDSVLLPKIFSSLSQAAMPISHIGYRVIGDKEEGELLMTIIFRNVNLQEFWLGIDVSSLPEEDPDQPRSNMFIRLNCVDEQAETDLGSLETAEDAVKEVLLYMDAAAISHMTNSSAPVAALIDA